MLDIFFNLVPNATQEERENSYTRLSEGARPDFDFFVMIGLSAIIATFGLITNNVAVIIGAMLVAPLMTPILSLSLSIISGDFILFLRSLEAVIKGVGLAVLVAIIFSLFAPGVEITPEAREILLRTSPTLFDLVIALAAGAAGAYALVNSDVSESLPGIAIAVSLLPPLAVGGIGIGLKQFDIAAGSMLLFLANIIAINASALLVFWWLGFGPKLSKLYEKDIMKKLQISIVLLLLVAIPLGWIMLSTLNEAQMKSNIKEELEAQIRGVPGTRLLSVEFNEQNGLVNVFASISSPEHLSDVDAIRIKNALQTRLNKDVKLDLEIVDVNLYTIDTQ